MRKYIVLGLLSVFTLVGGTAVGALSFVRMSTDFYYTGPSNDEDEFFKQERWVEGTPDACSGSADVPCHLSANDRPALISKLASYGGDVSMLIGEAGKRSY